MKVAIVGDGLIGCVAANLIQQQFGDWQVCAYGSGAPADKGKSIVVNKGVADVLQRLDALPANSQPITNIDVRFVGGCTRGAVDAPNDFYYGICPHATLQLLREKISHQVARVDEIQNNVDSGSSHARLITDKGVVVDADLIIIACALPRYPAPFPLAPRQYDYHQTILSLVAGCETWQQGSAYQYFFKHGIGVLVPRSDDKVGVILCLSDMRAPYFNAQSNEYLSRYLSKLFSLPLSINDERFVYAPTLRHQTPLASSRIALVGQGATTLHPIGAQSLRLGVSDCTQLVASIKRTQSLPQNIPQALAHYAKTQIPKHRAAIATTTALATAAHFNPLPLRMLGGLVATAATAAPFKQHLFTHLKKLA